ncbi:MAG: adenylate/guanylate cyclase domain-containing protein [Actinomycetota bacterium]
MSSDRPNDPPEPTSSSEEESGEGRVAARLKKLDSAPRLVRAAQALRNMLPGDRDYGDRLSVAGSEPPQLIGQRLTALTAERPSALREVGFSALQVWQSLSEAQGRGLGDEEVVIVFNDLVGFSDWTLEAGDTLALELLRRVGQAVEPPIEAHGGRIVKRLGDGVMAVFGDPAEAVEAALEGSRALDDLEVGGYSPRVRTGIHMGRPRRLGGDYYGVDVNIAARVATAAGPGEVLVSDATLHRLDTESLELKRRYRFRGKGAPKDLKVYAAEAAG